MTASHKQHRILIVDDVLENIKVLVHALESEYKLSVATNGKDALRIADSEKPPDLILLDIMMPGMDGYEVFKRLKSKEESARIPVIFLTAKSQDMDEELGLDLGAVDYITKPFSLPVVKARVRSQIDRKKAEDAERRLERLEAIAELASGVAHHFNNMLQVIMGGASVALLKLEQGELDGSKAMLRQIIESSRFGAHTVHRLQDFVKMRTSSMETRRDQQPFDLSDTAMRSIEATRASWETSVRENGLTMELITNLSQGCLVKGNEGELFTVIVNLIRNALEAMPDGGRLCVETSVADEQVRLQVTDSGMGIARDHLHEVFEPFFTTKGFQRVGMGLPSSYGIVKSHGGTISVESDPGQGSVFTVTLPLAQRETKGSVLAEKPDTLRPLRILVIDDVEPITKMLAEMLAEFGHEVLTALSGKQGLQLFVENPVNLVICDLGMPEMNGWEVGKHIRKLCAQRQLSKPSFILLTGWGGQNEEKARMTEAGVDAVLEKPLDPAKLHALIHELPGTETLDGRRKP